MLFVSCVYHAFTSIRWCLVVTCWERADLLALVSDVYLCFCHIPMWYPDQGVVLDCFDSLSWPPFLLSSVVQRLILAWAQLGIFFSCGCLFPAMIHCLS